MKNFRSLRPNGIRTSSRPDAANRLSRLLLSLSVAVFVLLAAGGLSSCNVTRTITNESQYFQRGDTTVIIQTKTVESYDASKKL